MAASTKSGSGDASSHVLPPHMEWAQRKDRVWLTVVLENCKNPTHEFKPNSFYFKGKGGTENAIHEVTLELYGEIDPEKSTCRVNDRQLFFQLMKKDSNASYWPRLTKDQKKRHYLKTDFNKWRDEDDSADEEEKEDFNLDEMMNSMGGLNGGEFGGPAGEEQEDSDDEELPDLQ